MYKPGQAVYYVSDIGSRLSASRVPAKSKAQARKNWQGKDPIKVSGGTLLDDGQERGRLRSITPKAVDALCWRASLLSGCSMRSSRTG